MALQVLYSGRSGSDLWNSQLPVISTLTAQDFFNLDFYNLDFFALDFYYLDFTHGSQWISTILMSTIWMSRKWNSELPVFSTLPGEDFYNFTFVSVPHDTIQFLFNRNQIDIPPSLRRYRSVREVQRIFFQV